MIQNVLRDLGGIGLYGVISVCLFFTVFAGALIWALLQKKSLLKRMGSLPLNDESESDTISTKGNSRYE
jgi:hypothetical protein